jgi:Helicase conserved C-terminal domain
MGTSLADQLRSLPDNGLAALFALRPDLVVPVPADLSALAARAQTRVSVARALDPLDRFTLEILDALRLSCDCGPAGPDATGRPESGGGTTSVEAVIAMAAAGRGAPAPAAVRAAVDRLRARFLVYGPESALHVAAGVEEACSPYPAGLGRPAAELDPEAAVVCADPAGLRRAVLAAPPPARAVLDRLALGPPLGTATPAAAGDPASPVGWLIAHHLLVPLDGAGQVELPREVGMLLRRDVGPLGELHPQAPVLAGPARATKAVDSAGAGQALEAIRHTEALLDAMAAEPVPVLRSGGLGVRELRRLARTAGIDEGEAAVLVETAAGAGLVGEAEPDHSGEARFLPTLGYDSWRAAPLAQRWALLARAWFTLTRQPGLVGRRDERDRPLSALAPELDRLGAPQVRMAVLGALADAEPGTAADADDLLDLLAWRAARQFPSSRAEQVRWALSEAARLGVTGLGALTGYGRLLLHELVAAAQRDPDEDPLGLGAPEPLPDSESVAALDALLPAPVDHVLLQADLTMVVPGPAEPALAAELALVADAESANLFRVTPASVRRALDAGYSAADLHALFTQRSRTPVPQALTYLVDDVARRHGGLRVGSANAYLCSEDEALLVELLADRRVAELRLRRLAPTVLASPYASGRLLSALREAGYAPVPEDATGATVLTRPRARRAPPRRSPVSLRSIVDGQPRPPAPRLVGIVEQLRHSDAAARAARRAPVAVRATRAAGAQAHTQTLAVLQQALRDKQRVWVGYVDAHGGTASRLVRPVSMGAGYLRAEDDRTETLHTFALHRITAAVPED